MRNGETTSYSVLPAGTILPDELNRRAQHVFQRHFDGTATRPAPARQFVRIQRQVTECVPIRSVHSFRYFWEGYDEIKQIRITSGIAGTRRVAP